MEGIQMKYVKRVLAVVLLQLSFGAQLVYAGLVIQDIQIIDLGILPGGNTSTARDINNAGNIVGSSETLSGETHGFFLSAGVMTDISVLPGGDASLAQGINDTDQVVGRSSQFNPLTGNLVLHGFVWQGGVLQDLGAYPPQDDIDSSSQAYAINNAGLIAGHVDLAGVVWDLYGVPNFPPLPPYVRITDPGPFSPAVTYDINNAGQAVGRLYSYAVGFRWQAGVLEQLVPLQPSAGDDIAYGVNDLGETVGRGLLAPPVRTHATLWPDPSQVQDLGTLGGDNSEARDINNDKVIVGSSETAGGDQLAFIWHTDFGMQSLGTLGGANSKAFAINSAGQIVGESETASGELHATLWTVKLATAVHTDIKPGNPQNPINPRSRGKLTVAILTDMDFDASLVDASSVRFGPAEAAAVRYRLKDVDDDGDYDLVLKFNTQQTGIACGDTEATLTAQTFAAEPVTGSDLVRTVGCK